jgi:hypothetical protein
MDIHSLRVLPSVKVMKRPEMAIYGMSGNLLSKRTLLWELSEADDVSMKNCQVDKRN